MARSIDNYTGFLERHGRIVLACVALVMIVSIVGIARLDILTDFNVFMPPTSPELAVLDEMAESFGDTGQIMMLADVTDQPLDVLPEIASKLGELDGVASAPSPIPESVIELTGTDREEALTQFMELTGGATLIRRDGSVYALFQVLAEDSVEPRTLVDQARAVFDTYAITTYVSGELYLEAEVFRYILRIILTLPPVAIFLILFVFRTRIGGWRATILSMVPAIAGAAITLGGIGWIQGEVSMVSVLVPIFVIVLGSADGLHVTSHVIDGLKAGTGNRESVSRTLQAVGVPIVMTTVTTMAGFLSLLVINSAAIRQLGLYAAVGMLVAGAATWVILPTVLLHQKPLTAKKPVAHEWSTSVLAKLRGWPSIVIAVVLVAAAIPGVLMVRANFSMIDVYKPNTEVRQNLEKITEVVGGSIPVYVIFPADDQFGADLANAVLDVQDRARDDGIAEQSVSAYSLIRNVFSARSGDDVYPSSQGLVRTLVIGIRRNSPTVLDMFFAEDGTGRAVFFLSDLDNDTLERFAQIVSQASDSVGIEMTPVGAGFVIKAMNDQIIPQQVKSLILAAILVFILVSITQRHIGLGLAATIPILITLLVLFGVMGYARIDLSIITGIMSGLTIGVGIDYAIHYVSLLRQARKRGESDPPAAALHYVATPVLANAIGLAIGFTAMILSPLQIHVTLSILMWVTMIVSAGLSLTLLPTITTKRKIAESKPTG